MPINEIINLFAPSGVWAVLSVILIFYIIKGQEKRDVRQDEREKNYQTIILKLTNALRDVKEIKDLFMNERKET